MTTSNLFTLTAQAAISLMAPGSLLAPAADTVACGEYGEGAGGICFEITFGPLSVKKSSLLGPKSACDEMNSCIAPAISSFLEDQFETQGIEAQSATRTRNVRFPKSWDVSRRRGL